MKPPPPVISMGIACLLPPMIRRRLAFLPIQVEIRFAADQLEYIANLLEADAKKEVRIAAKAFCTQDVEIVLGIAKTIRTLAPQIQPVVACDFRKAFGKSCGR